MRLELSAPALERLLGGDSEIEAGLRYQIVENFTKKRIKSFINDETMGKLNAKWAEECKAEVQQHVDKFANDIRYRAQNPSSGSPSYSEVEKYIKGLIEKLAIPIVGSHFSFNKSFYERYLREQTTKLLDKMLNLELAAFIQNAISTGIGDRINVLVEAEIQRRLTVAKGMAT